jgi:hypothetical protein
MTKPMKGNLASLNGARLSDARIPSETLPAIQLQG